MRPSFAAFQALAALAALAACAPAHAGDVFTFKDWAVACDNTRHCAAVGYQSEESEDAVALWIGRAAGPDAPLEVRLDATGNDDKDTNPVSLVVAAGTVLKADGDRLDGAAFARALPQLLEADHAEARDGAQRLRLSLAGMKAALLKMDDLQGRIGTPGALVKKGTKPESGVPGPLPAPRTHALPAVAAKPGDDALLKVLVAKMPANCNDEDGADKPAVDNTTLHRLSATQVVLIHDCPGGGAYNHDTDTSIALDRPPYTITPVDFRAPPGAPQADSSTNAWFEDGRLETVAKGRGLNDCNSAATWAWSGHDFVLVQTREAPLCRGLPSGGYPLVTWTSTP